MADLDLLQLSRCGAVIKRTPLDEAEFRELPLVQDRCFSPIVRFGSRDAPGNTIPPLRLASAASFDVSLTSGDEVFGAVE